MQNSFPSFPLTLSTPVRLLIALLLGLSWGILSFFTSTPPVWEWLSIVIPVIAMIASILLDPIVRQGMLSRRDTITGILIVLLAVFAFLLIAVVLPAVVSSFGLLVFLLSPFALGLAAAFTIGNREGVRFNVISALVAWAGTSLLLMIATLIFNPQAANHGAILTINTIYVVVGFFLASMGGVMGRRFRIRLLGDPKPDRDE